MLAGGAQARVLPAPVLPLSSQERVRVLVLVLPSGLKLTRPLLKKLLRLASGPNKWSRLLLLPLTTVTPSLLAASSTP